MLLNLAVSQYKIACHHHNSDLEQMLAARFKTAKTQQLLSFIIVRSKSHSILLAIWDTLITAVVLTIPRKGGNFVDWGILRKIVSKMIKQQNKHKKKKILVFRMKTCKL